MAKRVTVLGSTGSIGSNALRVIEALGPGYKAVGLSSHRRWQKLADQARRLEPKAVAIAEPALGPAVREVLNGHGIEILDGPEGVVELAASPDSDIVLSAIVGVAGLGATLAAIRAGKRVALANKETLVAAGCLAMRLAQQCGAVILPVDSEHSGIFQALQAGRQQEVSRIIITASGGPFRTWDAERMKDATLEDALCHPTWEMGPKITIDSATLMNKALEIIEAKWLFAVEADKIEVVVHPESMIHSMVEFCDGSVVAQMGPPDMKTPIQYALTYPERQPGCGARLDLAALRAMHFEPPDMQRFPALELGYQAARRGGTAGAVISGANEAAVASFREKKIRFGDIVPLVADALAAHETIADPDLDTILAADRWARAHVAGLTGARVT